MVALTLATIIGAPVIILIAILVWEGIDNLRNKKED